MTGALAEIRVVEAATLFAAPLAGMLLGDFGAEVIKIEHPLRVDAARGHGPSKDGSGLWFKTLAIRHTGGRHGEHTASVLGELGVGADELARLRSEGVA